SLRPTVRPASAGRKGLIGLECHDGKEKSQQQVLNAVTNSNGGGDAIIVAFQHFPIFDCSPQLRCREYCNKYQQGTWTPKEYRDQHGHSEEPYPGGYDRDDPSTIQWAKWNQVEEIEDESNVRNCQQ